jgi:hypothetical protein
LTAAERAERRKIDGRVEYEAALDELLARAGRHLRIFDKQLGASYNTAHRHDALRRLLLAGPAVRVHIVVHDASKVQRECPRLINLLRRFSHAFSINETSAEAKGVYDPFAVLDERDYLHRFHYENARGLLGFDDVVGALALVQRFEELWETSAPAVWGTTLGL